MKNLVLVIVWTVAIVTGKSSMPKKPYQSSSKMVTVEVIST
jgi:hypothetical protein